MSRLCPWSLNDTSMYLVPQCHVYVPGPSMTRLCLVTASSCLQLLDIRVPQFAELYDSVTLSCEFDLAGGKLYSVKWYKDDFEFFRYIPDNNPPWSALPLPGIHVELSLSNMTTLRLTKLSFASTGSYRCEVSMEAPKFDTVMDSRNMTVRGESHT
uniref:Ig-like domain-containing protein n=1 Tax=Timema monikensis TaxID=170555 RepID=A0A7R9EJF5_9NEOP|nr:unnamed protein product [Timema monikensis]